MAGFQPADFLLNYVSPKIFDVTEFELKADC